MTDDKKDLFSASRRDFLRNTAITAAEFIILPRHVLGGKGFVAPSDRLSIAREYPKGFNLNA